MYLLDYRFAENDVRLLLPYDFLLLRRSLTPLEWGISPTPSELLGWMPHQCRQVSSFVA
jgi:hypothetical protein